MVEATENIVILSTQKIRATIIEGLIKSSLNGSVNIAVVDPDTSLPIEEEDGNLLILLDLMGVDLPAKKIINKIKSKNQKASIIALHMYRSAILVDPLFDCGVNGYIYYEPTKEELANAIISVSNGKNYKPSYLASK
ncbi:MAG: response regulator transcription factor [Balneolaceae bacterium]|nr:response regulator transcription factor [Balneolaceae bacterium]